MKDTRHIEMKLHEQADQISHLKNELLIVKKVLDNICKRLDPQG